VTFLRHNPEGQKLVKRLEKQHGKGKALSILAHKIPAGFAHGFCVLSDRAEVEYRCTALYHPESEVAVRWDDPEIGIAWPMVVVLAYLFAIQAQSQRKSRTGSRMMKIPTRIFVNGVQASEKFSRHFTLEPGDIIYTGTPEGVILGYPQDKRVWLKAGDKVVTEVEKCGTLEVTLVVE